MKIIARLVISLIAFSAISSNAYLYDRGNGMIYDSSLNITWLQDANYARTSGYDYDGYMNWQEATTWAEDLNYGGFSDWRLPSAGLIGFINGYGCRTDGSTDCGYNNTRSEIGHLYLELGNLALWGPTGYQSGSGWYDTTFMDTSTGKSVEFFNLSRLDVYKEAESCWVFINGSGEQTCEDPVFRRKAWAVRDGDVFVSPPPSTAVSEPSAVALGMIGFFSFLFLNRRK